VEVALDPTTRTVGSGDDPPARSGKLGPAVRIRDRRCDVTGELLQTSLDAEWQLVVR